MSLVLQAYAPVTLTDAKPAGSAASSERVLLVLGCAHPGCGSAPGSWRAFRCQLRDSTSRAAATAAEPEVQAAARTSAQPPQTVAAPQAQQQQESSSAGADAEPFGGGFSGGFEGDDAAFGSAAGFGADDGGFGADAFGGENEAANGALDFSDLGAALEECAAKQAQQQAGRQGAGSSRGREGRDEEGPGAASSASAPEACPSAQLQLDGPPLPEFHILAVEEPAAGPSSTRRKEHEHVQRLLEEYERQEQSAASRGGQPAQAACSSAGAAPAPSSAGGARGRQQQPHRQRGLGPRSGAQAGPEGASAQSDGSEDDDSSMAEAADGSGGGGGDGAVEPSGGGGGGGGDAGSDMDSWAGEEYEEDHVRGVEGAYLKFAARLARQPDQCVRYGRGCEVLWPMRSAPSPPPCPHCGAPRVFELQLMSPLIALVLECAEWLEGPDLQRHAAAINAAANWDFATVAVYTCSANCGGGATGRAREDGEGGMTEAAPGVVVSEEFVALVNEEQCHVPEELKLAK